jgi:type II secretory pathway pseudopilin PulG
MTIDNRLNNSNRQRGFSLIELSAALLFIAFIMVFLITTLVAIMRTYNKGIWLSQINQAGRQINTDIGEQARYASSAKLLTDEHRLCIGGVSYVWNVDGASSNKFKSPNQSKPLRLVRVVDSTGQICNGTDPEFNGNGVTNLLSQGVKIRQFDVSYNDASGLLKLSAVFATERNQDLQKKDNLWQCGDTINGTFQPGNNPYCAFAEFNVVVYRRN